MRSKSCLGDLVSPHEDHLREPALEVGLVTDGGHARDCDLRADREVLRPMGTPCTKRR